ncbi:MAG TPA: SDR family NAD(P)-dependent oxidoreductase [Chloroflexota bacterium]
MQEPRLEGKTALVTGGGRGIGRSIALALARAGTRVVITGRGQDALETVREELGPQAVAVAGDVSNESDVRRIVESAGAIDILINNAGIISPIAPLAESPPDAWRENLEVNLYGVYLTCRYTVPGMLERGFGRIINVSSGAARGRTAGWSAYSASKAGVESLTKVLAIEVGDRGVHVNAIRPGIVDTDMQVEIRSTPEELFDSVERFRGYKERGALRSPDDPARLVLWLLSEEADNLNGEVLNIDDPEVAARMGLVPMGR